MFFIKDIPNDTKILSIGGLSYTTIRKNEVEECTICFSEILQRNVNISWKNNPKFHTIKNPLSDVTPTEGG